MMKLQASEYEDEPLDDGGLEEPDDNYDSD
jgi:hypothetical protein